MSVNLKKTIRTVPDFPKSGVLFFDITTLLNDHKAFGYSLDLFEDYLKKHKVNRIVAIDSRGFLFGGALADRMNLPLSVIRKKGKLPFKTYQADYALEYGTDQIEIHIDAAGKGDRVAIIDDLLATGGTLDAAVKLIEKTGAEVAAIGMVIELTFLKGRDRFADYNLLSLVQYDSE